MNTKPPTPRLRVSVVMAVNRDDGYLAAAVQSILQQSLTAFEFIIVVNGCHDELWCSLQRITDQRVRLLRSDLPQLPFNLNLGIQLARAPYVARMDADDIAHGQRLWVQCEYLDQNPRIAAVGARYQPIDKLGRPLGDPPRLHLEPDAIRRRLPFESCLPHPTVVARREALLAVGGYAYGLFAEDWDLWLRMGRAGFHLANLDQVLLSYRIHPSQSVSQQHLRRNLGNVVALQLRELIIQGRPAFLAGLLLSLGRAMLGAGLSAIRRRRR